MKKIILVLAIAGIALAVFAQSVFPTITCETLKDKKVTLPDDVKGKKTVVAVLLSTKADKQFQAWAQPLYNSLVAEGVGGLMGGRMYDANLCFVGMVRGLAKLALPEMKEKAKKNVDSKLHNNFMYCDSDVDAFTKTLNIKDKSEPYFFVLDKDGNIIYQTSGQYSDEKLNGLTEKLM